MTRYLVFRSLEGVHSEHVKRPSWERIGEYEGRDGKAAIEAAVLSLPDDDREGTFGVCATSTWQQFTPKVKVETKVSFA